MSAYENEGLILETHDPNEHGCPVEFPDDLSPLLVILPPLPADVRSEGRDNVSFNQ